MSEEYAKGFKDGFAAGLEEGKKLNDKSYTDGLIDGMKKTMPAPYNPNPYWPPHWPYVTCDVSNVVRGAVGSEVGYTYAAGANGPAGSIENEKEMYDRYNSVWVNGSWVSLGS